MSDAMARLGLWLLRNHRLRIDASCPHGTFVPGRRRLSGPSGWWSCDDCGFKFHVAAAALDGPHEQVAAEPGTTAPHPGTSPVTRHSGVGVAGSGPLPALDGPDE